MPIRIYALAKELGLDSKDLVDACKKAGITGKGSALASLDDDEAVKVKDYLAKPAGEARSPGGAPQRAPAQPRVGAPVRTLPPSRPSQPAKPPGKPPVLAVKKGASKDSNDAATTASSAAVAEAATEAAPAEVTREPVEESPVVKESVVSAEAAPEAAPPVPAEPAAPPSPAASDQPPTVAAEAAPEAAPGGEEPRRDALRRDTMMPANQGKIKVLGRSGGNEAKPDEQRAKKKTRKPVIKVAKMPEVQQPAAPRSDEPTPQKPEIRLPKDAITGSRKGARPPLEHITAKLEKKAAANRRGETVTEADPSETKGVGRGKGKAKVGEKAGEKDLAGMSSSRADRQKSRRTRSRGRTGRDDEPGGSRQRRGNRTLTRTGRNTAAPRKGKVALELPCTVRSFSEAAGVAAGQVLGALMRMGVVSNLNINSQLDEEAADVLAEELGVDLEFKAAASLENDLRDQFETDDAEETLVGRPPIVTFLGHVDHGKTSLLDYLIGINVVSGEAGGITQHIRAYQVPTEDGRTVSFVDTPGHEAFTAMRARGANVTDIVVLVVAADDGIMPQTEEAINHAKAAEVPIVVALNKIDLPGVDVTRILGQLAEHGLMPSEWGGEVEVVRTSAITGEGMDELLETLLTVAELHELTANPERPAMATCLEAQQEPGRGVVAKAMVRKGTLREGDIFVCGASHGRVRAMYDTLRPEQRIEAAGPSMPINLTGFDVAPEAGDMLYVLDDITKARELASQRATQSRGSRLSGGTTKISFEQFQQMLTDGRIGDSEDLVELRLIIRADVRGSVEAILKELDKLDHPEVRIKILQASVGGVTVGDIELAHTSEAVVVAFNVIADENARLLADERGVEVRRYNIIYKVTDDIRALIEGRLKPDERVVELGRALVKQVFEISRVGAVAGCYIAQGTIERGCRIRVNRDGRTIGDYALDSLRREKEDVKEVPRGMECGIKLQGFNDIKKDDILESYKIEEVARTL